MKTTTLLGYFFLLLGILHAGVLLRYTYPEYQIRNCKDSGFMADCVISLIAFYWFGGLIFINKPKLIKSLSSDVKEFISVCLALPVAFATIPLILCFECYNNHYFALAAIPLCILNYAVVLLVSRVPLE